MKSPIRSRLIIGAIAGFAATVPMTAAMRALHRRLPDKERYPLPPREIIQAATASSLDEQGARDTTLAAHFVYGALAGAAVAAVQEKPSLPAGAAAGVAIWVASYFGWIPAVRLLEPASQHPPRRNGLMIGAHLVWGAATAASIRELQRAQKQGFSENGRPSRDLPEPAPVRPGRRG